MNRNDRAIVGLVMLAHGMVHTYELSIPIFVSIWLTEFDVLNLGVAQFGVTEATLGLVVTAGYALFGLGALPGGVLVDKVGSRVLITACLFGMGGAFFVLGVAPSLLAVAVALLLWGAAASLYHPAGLALLSKGVEDRGSGFAFHGIAGNVGTGLGPLAAAVMLLFLDWTTVAIVLAVPALVASLFAIRAEFDETAAVSTDGGTSSKADAGVSSLAEFVAESRILFTGSFVAVFVVVMCSGLFYRGIFTFLPTLLEGLPGFDPIPVTALLPDALSGVLGGADAARTLKPERYFYSGLLLVGVAGQYVGGKLTDRLPTELGMLGGFSVLAVVGVVFLPVANMGIVPLLVLGAVLGFVFFGLQPMYQATVAEYTPAGTRGLSYGYTYLGVFGIGALGGAIAGGILTYATPPVLFSTLTGFAVVAAGLSLYLLRRG